MRDYILSQAEALERSRVFPRLRGLWRHWRQRRQVFALADFDDHVLKDIGLTRADVEYVLTQPLDVDPGRELARLAGRNQRLAGQSRQRPVSSAAISTPAIIRSRSIEGGGSCSSRPAPASIPATCSGM